jgi:hypothetical protein
MFDCCKQASVSNAQTSFSIRAMVSACPTIAPLLLSVTIAASLLQPSFGQVQTALYCRRKRNHYANALAVVLRAIAARLANKRTGQGTKLNAPRRRTR